MPGQPQLTTNITHIHNRQRVCELSIELEWKNEWMNKKNAYAKPFCRITVITVDSFLIFAPLDSLWLKSFINFTARKHTPVTWCRFNFNCASVPLIRTHTNFPSSAIIIINDEDDDGDQACVIEFRWYISSQNDFCIDTTLWPLVTHFSCSTFPLFRFIAWYFHQNQLDWIGLDWILLECLCRSLFVCDK